MNRVSERPSILIVDDAPENIDILSAILKNDYRILVANNGERAQEICQRHLPSLILLDVMMPGLNGYEVCRRLKQDPITSDIPVIFVTAADRDQDEVQGLAAGGVDFITKPVSPPIVAARVRTHVELKMQRDLLRKLSQVDGLTGVGNRRSFDEALACESRRCTRTQSSLALLLVDIDYFKSFNDLYGHQAGDRCLRRIAATLTACLGRPGDMVARLRSDRFACVLPDTSLDGLRHLVEHIGRDVGNLYIPHARADSNGYLTISMGGLVATPDSDWTVPNLLPRTDELLMQAKRNGRARSLIGNLESASHPDTLTFNGSRGFDPEVGLHRTGGVLERYRNFVARFIAEHAGDARVIEDNLARDDRGSARRVAHTLESIAGSLGANALADAAAHVSSSLHEGKAADDELDHFRQELQATLKEMQAMLASGPAPGEIADRELVARFEASQIVGNLATLIASYDAEAVWFFERHRPVLEQVLTREQFQGLDAGLTHFDYDSAMTALHGRAPGVEK